jgi:hypothetical protein
VDSTGIKVLGAGEWQARKHGVEGRRQWRKVHLAVDPATSGIRAVEFTPSRDGDGPVRPDLLGQIPAGDPIGTVTAPSRRCTHRLSGNGMPHRHHRPAGHADHPDPQERTPLEG